jgi:hypothetical protein
MLTRFVIALVLTLVGAVPVAAAPTTPAVSQAAEPLQFYVFSFTDTPAAEAAQDVVIGALAYDLQVDPAVVGIVTFQADGWYSGEALLRDFGTALLDEDLALIRTGPGAYALVPRANAPMLMARGGVVMRLAEPVTARPALGPDDQGLPPPDGAPRWWQGAVGALMLFLAGAASGAAALTAGSTILRRAKARQLQMVAPVLRLTDQRARLETPVEAAQLDPDLVIPRFEDRR